MRVIVKSVYDAFDYVMDHFAVNGCEEFATRKDNYVVISIQDTHVNGFGFEFNKNKYCSDVLTLYFDDIIKETEGGKLFTHEQAKQIIAFVNVNISVETLLVHCYAGKSRSAAVGAFVAKMLGKNNENFLKHNLVNEYVYKTLCEEFNFRNL